MHKIIFKSIILSLLLGLPYLASAQTEAIEQKSLLKVYKLINTQYVDTVNNAKIVADAIKAMVGNLDPHSKYMTAESIKRSNESIRGSFGGIGVYYQILNDTLIILNTVPNGPSEKAGIKAGDKLLKIDGEAAYGEKVSNTFFSKKLRGKQGSQVQLEVLRHNDNKAYTIDIIRDAIPIHTLDIAFMLDKETGYIRLNMFSRSTMREFNMALIQLRLEGMKHLILDLRGNPGGLMIASIHLSDEFLSNDKLIVYTQGEHYKREDFTSSSSGEMKKGRVIVLMDEYSASASEIYAGAIQDWDRGLIMGRRSFGKGLVGRNFTLPDGAAVRLTTGRYYTPSGRNIQKSYANGRSAYNKELDRRYKHGEYIHADSIQIPDSLKFLTNGGRTIYGGGGIMPDIFFPMDTSYYSQYLRDLNRYSAIVLFAGHYFDNHLEQLQLNYPNYNSFHKNFVIDQSIIEEFKQFCDKEYKLKVSKEDWQTSHAYIQWNLKAVLARSLFEGGAYYRESADYDLMIQKAKNTIKETKAFKLHGVQSR